MLARYVKCKNCKVVFVIRTSKTLDSIVHCRYCTRQFVLSDCVVSYEDYLDYNKRLLNGK